MKDWRIILSITILALIIGLPQVSIAAEKSPVKKKAHVQKETTVKTGRRAEESAPKPENTGPHDILINAGAKDDATYMKDWSVTLGEKDIYNWGKSLGIYAIGDAPPVVDKRARFVSRFGSSIRLTGLNGNNKYRLWCDFVIYKNAQRSGIVSQLEIFMDEKIVKTLNFGDATPENNPFCIEIPYELVQDGSVEIYFRERSANPGVWGVWDCVLSDRVSLPDTLAQDEKRHGAGGKMEIKKKLLENRRQDKKSGGKIVGNGTRSDDIKKETKQSTADDAAKNTIIVPSLPKAPIVPAAPDSAVKLEEPAFPVLNK